LTRLLRHTFAALAIALLALEPTVVAAASAMPVPMQSAPMKCHGDDGGAPHKMTPNGANDCMLQCGVTLGTKVEIPFLSHSFHYVVRRTILGDTLMPFIAGAPPSPPPRSSVLI